MPGSRSIRNFIRINQSEGGAPLGTGFMVSKEGDLITCAHVIRDVAGMNEQNPPPVHCSVLVDGTWTTHVADLVAYQADFIPDHDIAHLRLREVPDIEPLQFIPSRDLPKDAPLLAVGFNIDDRMGDPDTVKIERYMEAMTDDAGHNRAELILKEANDVVRGYSGSPLVYKDQYVVGMIKSTPHDKSIRKADRAYAIPTEVIIDVIPNLKTSRPARKASDVPRPEVAAKCNRAKQQEVMDEVLYVERGDRVDHKRIVVFISLGDYGDKLQALSEAFGLKLEGKGRKTQAPDPWKSPVEVPSNLAMRLEMRAKLLLDNIAYERLPGKDGEINPRDLYNSVTDSHRDRLVISHDLNMESWDAKKADLLEWYLKDFWAKSTDEVLVPTYLFINIFCTGLADKGPSFLRVFTSAYWQRRWGNEYVSKLCTELTSMGLEAYPFLDMKDITPDHVERWETKFFSGSKKDFVDAVFQGKQTKLPMRTVYKRLKQLIEEEIQVTEL